MNNFKRFIRSPYFGNDYCKYVQDVKRTLTTNNRADELSKILENFTKNITIRTDATIGILLNKYSFKINIPKRLTYFSPKIHSYTT